MSILPLHWTTLIDAIRSGAVRQLQLSGVDIGALESDAILVAVGCRGLQSLEIGESVLPSGFGMDDLLRCGVARGVPDLSLYENDGDAPHGLSDNGVLDFCFPVDAAPEERSLHLNVESSGVTNMFFAKFVEVTWFRVSPLIFWLSL